MVAGAAQPGVVTASFAGWFAGWFVGWFVEKPRRAPQEVELRAISARLDVLERDRSS